MHLVGLILASALALVTVHAQTPNVITQCSDPGVVALTFDDGPSENTESLLDSLKAAGVPATFFLLGVQIDQISNSDDLLQRMYDEGHQLALHTQTHPDLETLSTKQRTNEMNQVLTRVQNAVDLRPNYMRPPFGSCSDDCVSDMSAMNYQVVIWNLDSNDWRFRDNGTSILNATAGTKENILSVIDTSDSETDNFISLQHDTINYSVSLVPQVISAIRSKGYTFSTVSDCLDNGVPPYADDDDDLSDTGDDGYDDTDDTDESEDAGKNDNNQKGGDDAEDEKNANDMYTLSNGIANNTFDNGGNPTPANPTVSQKNHNSIAAAAVDISTNATNRETDESGAAPIAPHAIIIILSTITMFAL